MRCVSIVSVGLLVAGLILGSKLAGREAVWFVPVTEARRVDYVKHNEPDEEADFATSNDILYPPELPHGKEIDD
jgi:hypothetical protein